MRALKALVVIMGIAILVGTGALVTLIIERGTRLGGAGGPGGEIEEAAPDSPTETLARSHALALPPGARVIETRLGDGNLALRVALEGGGEAVFVFDAASGALVARYDIATPPAP